MMTFGHHRFAAIFMVVSLLFLGGAIVAIKKIAESPKSDERVGVTNFNLSKVKPAQKKRDLKKVKRKRQKMRRRMKALRPVLTANLSGQSFGLDLAGVQDLGLDDDLLADNQDVIMDESSVDSKPRILSRPPVEFPERALSDNILKGMVELRMLINKDGRVENTEILSANPKGYFEDVVLSMVQEWSFEPATYRGKRVAIWAKQVVKFGE